jgi:hypothetical protein
MEPFCSSFLEWSGFIPCLIGRTDPLDFYLVHGMESGMILTWFDTVKRSTHMSMAQSSGAHMSETIKKGSSSSARLWTSSFRCCPPPAQSQMSSGQSWDWGPHGSHLWSMCDSSPHPSPVSRRPPCAHTPSLPLRRSSDTSFNFVKRTAFICLRVGATYGCYGVATYSCSGHRGELRRWWIGDRWRRQIGDVEALRVARDGAE